MGVKAISFRIGEEFLETGEALRKQTLEVEDLAYFRIQAKSMSMWHCHIYELGLIKCREEYEKFKKNLEKEDK